MVSQALASMDAWLVRAEEVLQAQREHGISPSSVPSSDDDRQEWTCFPWPASRTPWRTFWGASADVPRGCPDRCGI
jgi:hypothetical protein